MGKGKPLVADSKIMNILKIKSWHINVSFEYVCRGEDNFFFYSKQQVVSDSADPLHRVILWVMCY